MPEPRSSVDHLRGLLNRKSCAAGVRAESTETFAADPQKAPDADEVVSRVRDTMAKIPEEEIADPDAFRRALTIFLKQAETTLRKMGRNPEAPLERQDVFAIEAVIKTDGTRPSLLIRNGLVNADHPLAGGWRDSLIAAKDAIRACARAVGRVEPSNATAANYFGTGWVVKKLDDTTGLVLTNRHVLEAMREQLQNSMSPTASGFSLLEGAAFIDFAAESGSLERRRFQVVSARNASVDGAGFARLDAAVLTIKRIAGETIDLPPPIPVIADTDGPIGNLSSFCVIGYPATPPFGSGIHEGVDWAWVNATLFGGRFGVKRLAPGIAHRPLGSLDGDARQWVFGHDATTLGGSSGSPVIAWLNQGGGGFGLHFAGASVQTNCAHAIAQCRAELEALGVPVSDPS